MGNSYLTNFASFKGQRISVFEAEQLQNQGYDLGGKLHCLECNNTMKFIDWEHENYFAHVNVGDDNLKVHKAMSGESYIHKLTKEIIASKDYNYIVLDGKYIKPSDIISIKVEKTLGSIRGSRRPDIVLETIDIIYYIEVFNKHKVSKSKLAYYRQENADNDGKPFKVIEIDVSDIDAMSTSKTASDIVDEIKYRLAVNSKYVVTLDLSIPEKKVADYIKAPFGRCYHCNSEYELCANSKDSSFSRNALSDKINTVRLIDAKHPQEENELDLGVAFLHCTKCSENRYVQIQCPDCLAKGIIVPMKILRNTTSGRIFLACNQYSTSKSVSSTGEESGCNCTITVFEGDGITLADELLSIKGFGNWLKRGSKLKSLEQLRKKFRLEKNNE